MSAEALVAFSWWTAVSVLAARSGLRAGGAQVDGLGGAAIAGAVAVCAHIVVAAMLPRDAMPAGVTIWGLVLTAAALPEAWRLRRARPRPGPLTIAVLASFAVIVGAEVAGGYATAVSDRPDGGMRVQVWPVDWDFHSAIVAELRRSIPPELPFFAGSPMNYHYLFDLFALSLIELSGAGDIFGVAFLIPAAAWLLLLTAGAALSRELGGSDAAGVAGMAFASFLGGALTPVVGAVALGPGVIWEHAFHAQPTLAHFTVNPSALSMGTLLAGLLAVHRYTGRARGRWLAPAILLLAFGATLKIFAGAAVLGGLLVAGALVRGRTAVVAVGAAAAAGVLLLPFVVTNATAGQLVLALRPAYFTTWSLDYLRLGDAARRVDLAVAGNGTAADAAFAIAASAAVLVAGAGQRVLGLPAAVRALRTRTQPVAVALTATVAIGAAVALLLRLHPRDYPGWYNNLGFVHHAGLTALALLSAAVWPMLWRRSRAARVAVSITVFLAAVAMIQFLVVQASRTPLELSAAEAGALRYARERTSTGSTFLVHASGNRGAYPWIERIAGRRVVLGADWAPAHAPRDAILARTRDVQRFYDGPASAGDVLRRYAVDYILITPMDPVADAAGRFGDTVYSRSGFVIIRVRPP